MPAQSYQSMSCSQDALPEPATRILVADDHDLVCAGLEQIIATQEDMEICATACSGTEALRKAIDLTPDIAILDMQMGGLNGLEATRAIRQSVPGCEVLLFTGLETDDLMREAFASGAKAFVLKSDARTHLTEALASLAQHKPYFTNAVSEVIFARILRKESATDTSDGRLTTREREIVKSLAQGDGNRELSQKLNVNLRTAEGLRAAVMKKMNFDSLADLVRYAVRNEIVKL
jgi:DNA-binding NarL/FixJ family response regulator